MTKPFAFVLVALLVAFASFMTALAYLNGKMADESLKRELLKPSCISVPYSVSDLNRGKQCYVKS